MRPSTQPLPAAGADPDRPDVSTHGETRRSIGWEIVGVLGVSLGISGVFAVLDLIRAEVTVKGGISATTATVVQGQASSFEWLDVLDRLAGLVHGIFPAVLVLALLARSPGGRGFGAGLDSRRLGREVAQGVGFLALIGLPGLALVWAAHAFGLNASLQVVNFPDVWYRLPYLVLSAAQNGVYEEVVVVAYLLTRLRQLGWSDGRALAASAVLRGSYHLYQGFGGFLGNLVMGLVFGWWFQRTRRVLPLAIAHTLLDVASFVGYIYLRDRISWI